MDFIKIGIFSEHQLLQEGICSLIENTQGINISLKENSIDKLLINIELKQIHILILHPQVLDQTVINLIGQ
jgi:hypothetical protein